MVLVDFSIWLREFVAFCMCFGVQNLDVVRFGPENFNVFDFFLSLCIVFFWSWKCWWSWTKLLFGCRESGAKKRAV